MLGITNLNGLRVNGARSIDICPENQKSFNKPSNCVIEQFELLMLTNIPSEQFKQKLIQITNAEVITLTKHLFSSKTIGDDDSVLFKLVALSLKKADNQKLDKLSHLTSILTEKIFDILNNETYIAQNTSVQHLRSDYLMLQQIAPIVTKSSELANGIRNNQENIAGKISCEINFLLEQFTKYRIQLTYQTTSRDNYSPVINPDQFDSTSKDRINFAMNTRMDIFQNQIVGLYKKHLLFVLDCHKKCNGELKSSDIRAFELFLSMKRVREIRGVSDVLHILKYLFTPESVKVFKQKITTYKNLCTTKLYLTDKTESFKIENTAQVEEIYHSFLTQKKFTELELFIKKLNTKAFYATPKIREFIAGYVFEHEGFYGSILTHVLRMKSEQPELGISNNCIRFAKSLQRKSITYQLVKRFDHNQLRIWICNYKLTNKLMFISDMGSILLATSDNNGLTVVQKLEVALYLDRQITPDQHNRQFGEIRKSRNAVASDLLYGGYFPNLHNYQDTRTFTSIEKMLNIFKEKIQRRTISYGEPTLSFTQQKISYFISANKIAEAIEYIEQLNDIHHAYFALTENYKGGILIDQLFTNAQQTEDVLFAKLNDYWSNHIVCQIITDEINLDPDLTNRFNNNDPGDWSMKDFSTYVGTIRFYGAVDCLKHFYRVMAVIYRDKDPNRQKNKLEYFNDIINRLNNRNKANNWQELRKVARRDRAYITASFKVVASIVFFIGGWAISATGIGLPIAIACGVLMSIMSNVLSSMISAWTEHMNTKEYMQAKKFSDAFLKTHDPVQITSAIHHNGTFPLLKHMTTVINMLSGHKDKHFYINKYFDNTNHIEKYFNETDASYLRSINEVFHSKNRLCDEVPKKIEQVTIVIEQILIEMQQGAVDKYLMTQAIFRLAKIIWESELTEQLKLESFRFLKLLFDSDLLLIKQLLKTHRNFTFQNYYFITNGTSGMLFKMSNFSLSGLVGHGLIYQPIIMLGSLVVSRLSSMLTEPFIDFVKKEPHAIRQNLDFLDMFIDFFEEGFNCNNKPLIMKVR